MRKHPHEHPYALMALLFLASALANDEWKETPQSPKLSMERIRLGTESHDGDSVTLPKPAMILVQKDAGEDSSWVETTTSAAAASCGLFMSLVTKEPSAAMPCQEGNIMQVLEHILLVCRL